VVAVLNVRRPDVHKRVMLVATVSILQAAVGRWFVTFLAPPPSTAAGAPPVAVTLMPAVVTNLLIVAAMLHDRRTRGSVHPAYWIAGGVVVAVQVLRVPLSGTGAWLRVTDWLLAMSP
jgi:heme A synthase